MDKKWVICVVVLFNKDPREYKTFYLGVKGTEEDAKASQFLIAKTGFEAEGRRFFPDEIETLTIKEAGDE